MHKISIAAITMLAAAIAPGVGREPNTGVKVGNPRAGITLSEKMSRAARGGQLLQWFSTHPSSATRIDTIKNNLKDVMPLYEQATAALGCLITHTYPQK